MNEATCITVEDVDVPHDQSTLFAKQWTPARDLETPGTRAPIVLFHDSLGSVELWRSFPEELAIATNRRVIAYDRLGYGRSTKRSGAMPFDFIEKEATDYFPEVQHALNFTEFVAFGHSVGGAMALNLAVTQPQNCQAVITESAQSSNGPFTVAGIRAAEELFENPHEFARLEKYHDDKTRWVLDAWIDTWCSPEFSDWSLRGLLPQVRCPILAIHGSEDEYGSLEQPQMITDLSGGRSKLTILQGVGHVPHRQTPQDVIVSVATFLEDVEIDESPPD